VTYDEAGKRAEKYQPGRWTWHGNIEVTKIDFKDRVLKIKANRIFRRYDKLAHEFVRFQGSEKVEIQIQTSTSDRGVDPATELRKAFLVPGRSSTRKAVCGLFESFSPSGLASKKGLPRPRVSGHLNPATGMEKRLTLPSRLKSTSI
jgi:hypothetical protein